MFPGPVANADEQTNYLCNVRIMNSNKVLVKNEVTLVSEKLLLLDSQFSISHNLAISPKISEELSSVSDPVGNFLNMTVTDAFRRIEVGDQLQKVKALTPTIRSAFIKLGSISAALSSPVFGGAWVYFPNSGW